MQQIKTSLAHRLLKGSVVSLFSTVWNFIYAFLAVFILLKFWGADEYGVWLAVVAATSMVTAVDLGYQQYMGNFLCAKFSQGDIAIKEAFSSAVRTSLSLSWIVFIGYFLVFFYFPDFGFFKKEESGFFNGNIAILIYLFFWAINGSVSGVASKLYAPAGLYAKAELINLCNRISGFLFLSLCVVCGGGLVEAMFAQVVGWMLCNFYLIYDSRKLFPKLIPWLDGGFKQSDFTSLRQSFFLSLTGVLDQFAVGGVLLLVSRGCVSAEVSLFGTLRTVANVGVQAIGIFLHPVCAEFVRYHHQKNTQLICLFFKLFWCFCLPIVYGFFFFFSFFIEKLYQIWTQRTLQFDYLLYSLLVISVMFRLLAAPLYIYHFSINSLNNQLVISSIRVAIVLGICYLFLVDYGIVVAGIAIIFSEIVVSVGWVIFTHKTLQAIGGGIPWLSTILAFCQLFAFAGLLIFPDISVWFKSSLIGMVTVFALFQFLLLKSEWKLGFVRFGRGGTA